MPEAFHEARHGAQRTMRIEEGCSGVEHAQHRAGGALHQAHHLGQGIGAPAFIRDHHHGGATSGTEASARRDDGGGLFRRHRGKVVAGAGHRTWRAYLSTQAIDGQPAINARDRIGKGPWANAKGQIVAQDVAHLHGDTLDQARLGNNLSRTTALTEKGEPTKGAGDKPNEHDIITGSRPDGTAFTDAADHSCRNYTSSGAGSVQVGHFDRTGGGNVSWNSAHASRGCSQENLVSTGGAGYFYCFAAD